ncbi:bifunctional DNA primase/polymerase [Solirubrobacter ginsenosidimutans]|uniref:Bifunctional DNA primase/polymerase n=1 Tax=Solirubrobacter ginsenosidimutans TaxID=490573 RepID=A0A9X3N2G2_9ACTN|nr:bifunctional DNA primase/polymerase [Solirubrobacter ginsenosidimutans]MDA0167170.1 bifunctional DNA primase/polymerase [Solirubrobacter ginsenosidimutans]
MTSTEVSKAAVDSGLPTTAPRLLTAALSYAVAGWPILPLHTPRADSTCSCRDRTCTSPGKHPRIGHWLTDATTDPLTIAAWWRRWPDANIGMLTGELVVLDVDGESGRRSLRELQASHDALTATRIATSARGMHLYFRSTGTNVRCSVGRVAPGIDVRGHGGYIVAPPSWHADQVNYRWATAHEIGPLPSWLAELLSASADPMDREPLPGAVVDVGSERARRYLEAAVDAELLEVARAKPGTRNATLNRAAFRLGQLTGAGLGDRLQLASALLGAAVSAGLGEREARATIASGLSAGERTPRTISARF